jgi:hypothetical protein
LPAQSAVEGGSGYVEKPSSAPPRRRSLLVTNQIGVEGVRAAQYDDEAELNESSNEKNAGRRRIGHVDIKYVGSSRGGLTHFGGATTEDPQIRRHHRREGGIPGAHRAKPRNFQQPEPGASRHRGRDRQSQGLFLSQRTQSRRLRHLGARRG